jgi:hypothetical protein
MLLSLATPFRRWLDMADFRHYLPPLLPLLAADIFQPLSPLFAFSLFAIFRFSLMSFSILAIFRRRHCAISRLAFITLRRRHADYYCFSRRATPLPDLSPTYALLPRLFAAFSPCPTHPPGLHHYFFIDLFFEFSSNPPLRHFL